MERFYLHMLIKKGSKVGSTLEVSAKICSTSIAKVKNCVVIIMERLIMGFQMVKGRLHIMLATRLDFMNMKENWFKVRSMARVFINVMKVTICNMKFLVSGKQTD